MKSLSDFFRRGPEFTVGHPFMASPVVAPSCDVDETESHFLMSFDLPGVKKEDIKIDLRDGALTVSGERRSETEIKDKKSFHSERFYGSFSRSFQLPPGVKPEQIEANFAEGVLRLAVPKGDTAKPQQIKIGDGKPGSRESAAGRKNEVTKASAKTPGSRPSERAA